MSSSDANQRDNTDSAAQGVTATPGATKQLLPPDKTTSKNILRRNLGNTYHIKSQKAKIKDVESLKKI